MNRRQQILIVFAFFVVNLALRLPGFFHELAPWTFCDEDLMVDYAFRMLRESNMKAPHFLSGGLNFYIPIFGAKFVELFRSTPLNADEFRVLARIATAGILSSATVFWMHAIVRSLDGSFVTSIATIAIFTFSPMILGISRYHYPDHYMVFFVTAALYAIVRIGQSRLAHGDVTKRYLLAGAAVGFMCSVKYSGVLLYLLMGFASFLSLLIELREGVRKPLSTFFGYVKKVIYATLAAGLAFIATNPSMFKRWEAFKEGLMVKHYGPAESLLPGIAFYSEVLYLTFFGVLGVLAFLMGVKVLFQRDRLATLTFLILPIGIPLFFARYNLLYNRNVILAAPFVIILSGFGLGEWMKHLKTQNISRKLALICMLLLFFGEPVYRVSYSYLRDFRVDSRLQAQTWLNQTFAEGDRLSSLTVESNSGCMYPKVMEVRKNPLGCNNYVTLDNWFGGIDSFGKQKTGRSLRSLLAEPDYKAYHFIAEQMLNVPEDVVKIKAHYTMLKHFDGAGPKVYVYKNTLCEETSGISRDDSNRSHSIQ